MYHKIVLLEIIHLEWHVFYEQNEGTGTWPDLHAVQPGYLGHGNVANKNFRYTPSDRK
jgi:hypothetical protein